MTIMKTGRIASMEPSGKELPKFISFKYAFHKSLINNNERRNNWI